MGERDAAAELGTSRDPLTVTFQDAVASIVLTRPDANAIDLAFAISFEVAAARCRDARPRVVVITAEGRHFCVGGDLKSFSQSEDVGRHLEDVTTRLHNGIATLAEMDAPLVVGVNGVVAGAGLGLICAADLVVASETSSFLMAYTKVGLSPDGGTSWFLARHVGLHRALDLALTNRVLNADEALEWGIVSRVVPDERLAEATEQLVRQLAAGPTSAYGATKRLLRSAYDHGLREQMAKEGASISWLAQGGDGAEGIRSFVERRDPSYTGEASSHA